MHSPLALLSRALTTVALLAIGYGCGESSRSVILIADAGNGRVVQMDDLSGAGWECSTFWAASPSGATASST